MLTDGDFISSQIKLTTFKNNGSKKGTMNFLVPTSRSFLVPKIIWLKSSCTSLNNYFQRIFS